MGVGRRFDPTKPIDDPKVWYPHPDLWVEFDPSNKCLSGDGDDDDDGDDDPNTHAFALDSADFAKLNRYIWTAKLLPTNRNDYMNYNSIPSNNDLPQEIWDAADGVIATYTDMKKEADAFLDDTWEDLSSIANKIFNYALNAGGNINSSYYRQILLWVDDYNKENNKNDPDLNKLQELKDSILALTKSEIKNADQLQAATDTARKALKDFHDACVGHQSHLEGSSGTLQNLLTGENGIIADLTNDIKEQLKIVANIQKKIEGAGTIAGITIDLLTEKDLVRLSDALKEVQALIRNDQAKLENANMISSDLVAMGTSVDDLVSCIQPAINTLEKIQGAWSAMSGDLQGLHDQFEDNLDNIPPLLLEEKQLGKIVEHWNQLKDDGRDRRLRTPANMPLEVDIFRKNSYMTTLPPRDTIQGFLDKIDAVGN
ncbi:hypothetical protein ONZ43_g4536 [Nemania bipapillata]|uniref:Uncharacterized protein n=1 Tax=Nemania bipapillata TaxID=110536 RepID=A0ACC2ILF8_9PEZI|nr:hypothetical protein ONZ43_g4536 [Nemania bipapillata]